MEFIASRGGRVPEVSVATEIAPRLLLTLASLHARGIVHRHLKPEHIMCGPPEWRLIDFFDAADTLTDRLIDRTGALEYCAPEVLEKPELAELFNRARAPGPQPPPPPTHTHTLTHSHKRAPRPAPLYSRPPPFSPTPPRRRPSPPSAA